MGVRVRKKTKASTKISRIASRSGAKVRRVKKRTAKKINRVGKRLNIKRKNKEHMQQPSEF